jgi:hypothetical protein
VRGLANPYLILVLVAAGPWLVVRYAARKVRLTAARNRWHFGRYANIRPATRDPSNRRTMSMVETAAGTSSSA